MFTDDNEEDSLLNPDNWTIGWYKLDEDKKNDGNLAANQPELLECTRYELCGEQQIIQIDGNDHANWRLYSMWTYAGVTYLKPMKQVRISQLQNEVHVFAFVAVEIIDGNPSVEEANHFAIIYNLINCRLEFVKLDQVQKIIEEDELVSFEVPPIIEALEGFMTCPFFNEFKPESKGPGDIRENENSINVEDDVLNVRCKEFQQNNAKGNESLDRDARNRNKRKGTSKTKQKETSSHVLTKETPRKRKPVVKYDSSVVEHASKPNKGLGRPKSGHSTKPTKRTKILPAVQNMLLPQEQKENSYVFTATCANQVESTNQNFANKSEQMPNLNSGQQFFSPVQHGSDTEKQHLQMQQFGYMGPNGFVSVQQPQQPALFPWPFYSTNSACPPSMTALHGNPFGLSNPFPMHQMQNQMHQTQQTPREADMVARCMLASQFMGMMSNFFR